MCLVSEEFSFQGVLIKAFHKGFNLQLNFLRRACIPTLGLKLVV